MSRDRTVVLDATSRLLRLRDRLSVAQIAVAVTAVALAGGISTSSLALFVLATVLAFVRRLPPEPSRRAQRLWTLGIFAALVATTARAFLRSEFLDAGVDFLLLLVVQRFFQRQRTREHVQLLLLGSLLMIVGAVIGTDLDYPILLVSYIALSCVALMVHNLVAEGERLGPRVMLELARETLRRRRVLLRAALLAAGFAALGGLLVFLLFPRWGVGAFLRGSIAGEPRSGFSNEVSLGGFGRIKEDATVIMHLDVHHPTNAEKRATWHLRGTAFDLYDNGRWRHSRFGEAAALLPVWGYATIAPEGRALVRRARPGDVAPIRPIPIPGFRDSQEILHATVTLEDIGADALFVAAEPLAVRLRPRGPVEERARLLAGRNREYRVGKPPGPVQYEFISRIGRPTRAELATTGEPTVPASLAAYVTVSPSIGEEVRALARELAASQPTRLGKVEAIMDHLAGYDYTLDQPTSSRVTEGADPLDGFVLDTQAGHCEYFATALAVMLREVGVPTRLVNGYYGAHHNPLGDFWAVRQADAHSWVEVHFGRLGWVTFDPTPPAGRLAGDDAPLWPAAAQLLDAVRNVYLEWVIDYDLGKQMRILEDLGLRRGGTRPQIDWGAVGLLAGLVGAAGLALLLLRRRSHRRQAPPGAAEYARLLRWLAGRGHVPARSESAAAFASRLRAQGEAVGAPMARFAEVYERVRFGAHPSAQGRQALARAAAEVRHAD